MTEATTAPAAPQTPPATRPGWMDNLSRAYARRRKNVLTLSGNTNDLFYSPIGKDFLPLGQFLYQELSPNFTVLRVDFANGITFFDERELAEVQKAWRIGDPISTLGRSSKGENQIDNVEGTIARNRHSPLPTLVHLRQIDERFRLARQSGTNPVKPLCIVIDNAEAFFPSGDIGQLSELDRQRVVTFLEWIKSPLFTRGDAMVILITPTRAQLSQRILEQPVLDNIQIDLPATADRRRFADAFLSRPKKAGDDSANQIEFEQGLDGFCSDAVGLKLTELEDMLETAARSGEKITRRIVTEQVKEAIEKELGGMVKIHFPTQTPDDVIGYKAFGTRVQRIFKRCEDPKTAVSVVLVSGPNGVGKTFQIDAYAAASGWIIIEIVGMRDKWFGSTEQLFERFRWVIRMFKRVVIRMDEADTKLGSLYDNNTHETERRLMGGMIEMQSDKSLLGKLVWFLMTARPARLSADIKSRAIQIPMFDLDGQERRDYIKELLHRNKIELAEAGFDELFNATLSFSNRDFDYLLTEHRASEGQTLLEVLKSWSMPTSTVKHRRLQSLVAAQHCTYLELLPDELRKKRDNPSELDLEVMLLREELRETA